MKTDLKPISQSPKGSSEAPATGSCTLYGIPNCDQVKKARNWLAEHGVAVRFHDFRRDGLNRAMLAPWLAHAGWETLVNRKGTTWRALPEERRPGDEAGAIELMLEQPSVIKRPVLEAGDVVRVGFSEIKYSQLFS